MELYKIKGAERNRKCELIVSDESFTICGDYFYLNDKEFSKVSGGEECLAKSGYMGLNVLRKRSPKKMFLFVGLSATLEIVGKLADKIGDIFFMFDTDWTNYFVNICAAICLIVAVMYLFSKKKVYEISFLSKRVCVDEKMFAYDDMMQLDKLLHSC